jgi:hypothetical protein
MESESWLDIRVRTPSGSDSSHFIAPPTESNEAHVFMKALCHAGMRTVYAHLPSFFVSETLDGYEFSNFQHHFERP